MLSKNMARHGKVVVFIVDPCVNCGSIRLYEKREGSSKFHLDDRQRAVGLEQDNV